MKSILVEVQDKEKRYNCLAFVCPGCIRMLGGSGLHLLPVNTTVKKPSWNWDGNLQEPTLQPSILTGKGTKQVCHSFLRAGVFQFLNDCKHVYRGRKIPMPDLPEWFVEERANGR